MPEAQGALPTAALYQLLIQTKLLKRQLLVTLEGINNSVLKNAIWRKQVLKLPNSLLFIKLSHVKPCPVFVALLVVLTEGLADNQGQWGNLIAWFSSVASRNTTVEVYWSQTRSFIISLFIEEIFRPENLNPNLWHQDHRNPGRVSVICRNFLNDQNSFQTIAHNHSKKI
jgi:hypothetical protein